MRYDLMKLEIADVMCNHNQALTKFQFKRRSVIRLFVTIILFAINLNIWLRDLLRQW